jgi:ATP/maltotriose-dependent transcriptional regulator MalT
MNAYVLTDIGNIARALGDYEQARSYYEAAHKIKEELGSPEGMAWALIHLGRTVYLQGKIDEAEGFFRRSEALLRDVYDPGGLSNALHGLGDTALARGELDRAWNLLRAALQIAADMRWTPHLLDVLTSIAALRRGLGGSEHAADVLTLIYNHPAAGHETRRRAAALLEGSYSTNGSSGSAQTFDLESVVAAILASATALQTSEAPGAEDAPTRDSREFADANQALTEPLTERELEVLKLIAEGLSNRQIAEQLVITVGTVKTYTNHLYSKLAVTSRTQAIARARELRLM